MPFLNNFEMPHWDDMFPKTLAEMRIAANEAYQRYEMTHSRYMLPSGFIPLENYFWGLTDTRYYHFDAEIPPSRSEQTGSIIDAIIYEQLSKHDQELRDMEIKPARLMPHDFEFLSKIEREFPGADVEANVIFRFKYGVPNKLFFLDPNNGSDWERKIQHAIEEFRRFGANSFPVHPGVPIVLVGPNTFRRMTLGHLNAACEWMDAQDSSPPDSEQDAQGAVSEGHIADKNHGDFKLTGKTVSADEIDDLLDRISEDVEKNTIPPPKACPQKPQD